MFITREVELEQLQISDDSKQGVDKRPLKEFIRNSIERRQVKTFIAEKAPMIQFVMGALAKASLMPEIERDWRQREDIQRYVIGASKRKTTVLRQNEADVAQAVASLSSVLITNESKTKSGPVLIAAANGGRVLYLISERFREQRFDACRLHRKVFCGA